MPKPTPNHMPGKEVAEHLLKLAAEAFENEVGTPEGYEWPCGSTDEALRPAIAAVLPSLTAEWDKERETIDRECAAAETAARFANERAQKAEAAQHVAEESEAEQMKIAREAEAKAERFEKELETARDHVQDQRVRAAQAKGQLREVRQKVETAVEDTIAGLSRSEGDYQLGFDAGANETTKAMYAAFDALSSSPSVGANSSSEIDRATDVLVKFMCCPAGMEHVDRKLLQPFGHTLNPEPVVSHNRRLRDVLEWIKAEASDERDPVKQLRNIYGVADRILTATQPEPTQDKEEKSSGVEAAVEQVAKTLFEHSASCLPWDDLEAFYQESWRREARSLLDEIQPLLAQPKEVPGEECEQWATGFEFEIEDDGVRLLIVEATAAEGCPRHLFDRLLTEDDFVELLANAQFVCEHNFSATGKKPPEVVGELRELRELAEDDRFVTSLQAHMDGGPSRGPEAVPPNPADVRDTQETIERFLSFAVESGALTQPAVSEVPGDDDAKEFLADAGEGLRELHAYRDFDPSVAEKIFGEVPGNSGGVEEGAEPINHGSIWVDKHSGATVGVLSCCAHSHDCDHPKEPIVSGSWHKGLGLTVENFAFPEAEFRARFLRLAEDASAYDALLSSSQLQLSDEDRERLEEAATELELWGHERDFSKGHKQAQDDLAAFLRKLAPQPQQHGEVEEDAERCSTCGKVGGGGMVPAPDSERCPTASMVPCPACGRGEGI